MRWIVLYDHDCGLCRWGVARLLRLDRGRSLRAVAIRSAEGDDLLSSIPPERRLETWHVRAPDGRIWSGGRAVPLLLRLLPGGRAPSALASRFPRTVDLGYGWVARHREGLGRLVGERACAVDPSDETERRPRVRT